MNPLEHGAIEMTSKGIRARARRHGRAGRLTLSAAMLGTALGGVTSMTAAIERDDPVNFESPHVHPIDRTPDGSLLLAVNTPDARLEVFTITGGTLAPIASIPVGLEPVSVRVRDDAEAWVVNHLSDSISIIDLDRLAVVRTILTDDEPADVVFAGKPERAFVTISQRDAVAVYDAETPTDPPTIIPIAGSDPRALATDGQRVAVLVFEAGSGTTVLSEPVVSSAASPYEGAPNPPPNAGDSFEPPFAPDLTAPLPAGLIVRRDAGGAWLDDNGRDWSDSVTWDLHRHGIAWIDPNSLLVSYATGLPSTNTALDLRADGSAVVVGIAARNEIRYEPNLRGRFIDVEAALVPAGDAASSLRVDLNPHLPDDPDAVTPAERSQSIGDPRGVATTNDGRVFVTGMGSSTLVELDAALGRVRQVTTNAGPTGVVASPDGSRLFVLERFAGTVAAFDTATLALEQRVAYFDPTPPSVRDGRPFLYDTHLTSGTGHVSCASCHVDGRMDQLAWDLGDPSGAMSSFAEECNFGLGGCEDWHPMKGPLVTQTLFGIRGDEPLHWRGDRANLAAFNPAYDSILAGVPLSAGEMAAFEAFVRTLTFPPNPNRELDDSLPSDLLGGDAAEGRNLFETASLCLGVAGAADCISCHGSSGGSSSMIISGGVMPGNVSLKVPQLRNLHEREGLDHESTENPLGFGFTHDGAVDSLASFLERPGGFSFGAAHVAPQRRLDMRAYLLSFVGDVHAGVGAQATIAFDEPDAAMLARRDQLLSIAAASPDRVELIARGVLEGAGRGFVRQPDGTLRSDLAEEVLDDSVAIDARMQAGDVMTWTLVVPGTGAGLAIDRDGDGALDGDEIAACSDPTDPDLLPTPDGCGVLGDVDGDGLVNGADMGLLLGAWGTSAPELDLDGNGVVDAADLGVMLGAWTG